MMRPGSPSGRVAARDRRPSPPLSQDGHDQGQVFGTKTLGLYGNTTFLDDPTAGGRVTTAMADIEDKPPAGTYLPQKIGNAGWSIGSRDGMAVLAGGGSYTPVPGRPTALNDRGDVAGEANVRDGQLSLDSTQSNPADRVNSPLHAYIQSQGVVKDLGTVPGLTQIGAIALNNQGQAARHLGHLRLVRRGAGGPPPPLGASGRLRSGLVKLVPVPRILPTQPG